jgi:hypothetical protein
VGHRPMPVCHNAHCGEGPVLAMLATLRVAPSVSSPPISFMALRGLGVARSGRESRLADQNGKLDLGCRRPAASRSGLRVTTATVVQLRVLYPTTPASPSRTAVNLTVPRGRPVSQVQDFVVALDPIHWIKKFYGQSVTAELLCKGQRRPSTGL